MAEIFLSYRRQDSQSATGRLADALEAHFGDERVFRDREFVAGEDFVDAIRRQRPIAPGHAGEVRMILREHPLGHGRDHDGDPG